MGVKVRPRSSHLTVLAFLLIGLFTFLGIRAVEHETSERIDAVCEAREAARRDLQGVLLAIMNLFPDIPATDRVRQVIETIDPIQC